MTTRLQSVFAASSHLSGVCMCSCTCVGADVHACARALSAVRKVASSAGAPVRTCANRARAVLVLLVLTCTSIPVHATHTHHCYLSQVSRPLLVHASCVLQAHQQRHSFERRACGGAQVATRLSVRQAPLLLRACACSCQWHTMEYSPQSLCVPRNNRQVTELFCSTPCA